MINKLPMKHQPPSAIPLQSSMDNFRAVQAERLKQLSLSSHDCLEGLKKKLSSAGETVYASHLCPCVRV